ncbi:MAG: hypothetical protein AAGG48_20850 [Planctomycetota bacterium]
MSNSPAIAFFVISFSPIRHRGLQVFLLFIATWWLPASCGLADDYSPTSRTVVSLSKPMTSIVDGQSFRSGLRRITDEAKLNLWLDRHVDPSALISVGPVGPTVFAAIEKLAASQNCVIAPIDHVVLVGRAEWVDRTLATLLNLKRISRPRLTMIQWEDLATPAEALAQASGSTLNVKIPHDLWPATKWTAMDRRVAVSLVLAQFDVKATFATSDAADFKIQRIAESSAVTRKYFPGGQTSEIQKLIAGLDPNNVTKKTGNQLAIKASATAHRELVAALIKAKQPEGPDPDADTFTVRRMTTTAANALQQLAASAGKKCVIEASAQEACTTMVTIEGKDVTLKELVQMVATQANVKATWSGDSVVVSQ